MSRVTRQRNPTIGRTGETGKKLVSFLFFSWSAISNGFNRRSVIVSDRAREIHNSAIVIDAHEDTPQRFLDEKYDIGSTDPKDPEFISLDKAKTGNLGALFFSIWVNPQSNQGHFAQRTLRLIDSVYAQADGHPDGLAMSFSADDIERSRAEHKLAVLTGIEGGHSIENDLGLLRDFYRLGVR